jgi:hypothetical protein
MGAYPMDNSPLRLCTGSVPFLGLRTKRGRRCSRRGAYDDEALDDCGVDRRLECAGTGHRGDPSPVPMIPGDLNFCGRWSRS